MRTETKQTIAYRQEVVALTKTDRVAIQRTADICAAIRDRFTEPEQYEGAVLDLALAESALRDLLAEDFVISEDYAPAWG